MTIDFNALKAPFPPDEIEWRVGATSKDKTKGMALAYIDARAVMERLDAVCGPENWQCRYPIANGKTCCEIGLHIGESQWVWKSDGAGDTDFEGAKGAFSDAFKRAAVRWGIGRYLYDLKTPWVAVEPRGKSYVIRGHEYEKLAAILKGESPPKPQTIHGPLKITELKEKLRAMSADIAACTDADQLNALLDSHKAVVDQCERDLPVWYYGNPAVGQHGLQDKISEKISELNKAHQYDEPNILNAG